MIYSRIQSTPQITLALKVKPVSSIPKILFWIYYSYFRELEGVFASRGSKPSRRRDTVPLYRYSATRRSIPGDKSSGKNRFDTNLEGK